MGLKVKFRTMVKRVIATLLLCAFVFSSGTTTLYAAQDSYDTEEASEDLTSTQRNSINITAQRYGTAQISIAVSSGAATTSTRAARNAKRRI